MLSLGKPVSLVQQKKQQWAQEREEMSHLYLPWGSGERYTNRLQVRNQFASSLDLHNSYEYQQPIQRQRSPSLPPIHNIIEVKKSLDDSKRHKEILNRNVSSSRRFAFYDEDGEGDTSGYGSETVNHRNQRGTYQDLSNTVINNPVVAWQQEEKEKRKQPSSGRSGMTDGALSARSNSGVDEGRPRWGDRGVATGRLWEPTAPTARLPQMQNQKKGTPSWVERGLHMIDSSSDVLVIDQGSSNSGLDGDRSSYNGSDEGKTFLRGQNVPLEPEIKAQRETKRIKALELQSAILNQLEEQEKRRQEERERKLKEERLEELRIQRQQEQDRIRLEEEKIKAKEKQLFEQRKLEALKKALEDAEKKAKQEKENKFRYQRGAAKFNESFDTKKNIETEHNVVEQPSPTKPCSPTKSSRTYNVPSSTSTCQNKENISQQTTAFNSPRSLQASNLNLFIHNVPPVTLTDSQFNIVPIGIANAADIIQNQSNNIQLAVLLPQNKNLYNMSLSSLNNLHDLGDLERVLTPKKYRTLKTKDACTQTDTETITPLSERIEEDDIVRNVDKNYSNIDENAPQDCHRNTKKDRRLRSEERYKKKDIESRPKWGANKPVAQYKKQSEKDPFYTQKRKVRQKYRPQIRHYLSQSSEDSRSPSPPTRSEKILENNMKQRNSLSQSFWRTKRSSHDLAMVTCPTNSVLPEFTSLSQITGDGKIECKKSPKLSSIKRLTMSQKFINDKYGSKKLWIDDVHDRHSKYSLSDLDNPRKNNDTLFSLRKEDNVKVEGQEQHILKLKTQNIRF